MEVSPERPISDFFRDWVKATEEGAKKVKPTPVVIILEVSLEHQSLTQAVVKGFPEGFGLDRDSANRYLRGKYLHRRKGKVRRGYRSRPTDSVTISCLLPNAYPVSIGDDSLVFDDPLAKKTLSIDLTAPELLGGLHTAVAFDFDKL